MQLFSLVFCWPWHCDNWMPAIIECLPMLVNTKRICLQWTRGWQIQTRVVGLCDQPLIHYWRTHSPRMVQGCRRRGGGFLSAYNYANIWIVCLNVQQYSTSQPNNLTNLSTNLWWQWNKQEVDRSGHTTASCSILRLTWHANLLWYTVYVGGSSKIQILMIFIASRVN